MKNTRPSQKRSKPKGKSSGVTNSARVPRVGLSSDHLLGTPQTIRREMGLAITAGLPNVAAGARSEYAVFANAAYQPFSTQTPAGYGKLMAFYSRAFVVGARIKLHCQNLIYPGTATAPTQIQNSALRTVAITTSSTALSTGTIAIDQGLSKWKLMGVSPDTWQTTIGVDVSRYLNKPRVLDDNSLSSLVTTNPTNGIFFHVGVDNLNSSAQTVSVVDTFELVQDVIFCDPITFT